MTTKRVTVSLPAELAARVTAAAAGRSVSAYVAEVLGERLDSSDLDEAWRAYVADVGVSDSDIAAADAVLDGLTAGPSTRAS